VWLAAAEQAPSAPGDSLIIAIFTFLGVVVTTVGVIVVQAIKSRTERTAPAPPAPSDTALLMQLAKEQGQLVQRADDSDERDDYQDKTLRNYGDRIEALERHNDHRDGGWRNV
jgi:flagellar biosynthesis/type III secretory pathway M-ring protein FliF/YscJ